MSETKHQEAMTHWAGSQTDVMKVASDLSSLVKAAPNAQHWKCRRVAASTNGHGQACDGSVLHALARSQMRVYGKIY